LAFRSRSGYPLSLGLNGIGESIFLIATVLLIGSIAAAVWLCTQLVSMLKQKDPQFIVIDEIVGFLLANFLAPFSFAALLWSFALFRSSISARFSQQTDWNSYQTAPALYWMM
jgi:phosphatidylglycerophosphatase A